MATPTDDSSAASCCPPACSPLTTGPAGPVGPAGANGSNGTNGISAYTDSTLAYVQPNVGASVLVTVLNNSPFPVGSNFFIENGGLYEILGRVGTTGLTLKLLDYGSLTAPGGIVPTNQRGGPSALINNADPVNAQYLVLALNGVLTDERRLVPGAGLSGTDGGAGNDYTLTVNESIVRGQAGLVNPGFDFNSISMVGQALNATTGHVGPNQWIIESENASTRYTRQTALSETTIESRYFTRLTKITSTGKFICYQMVKGVDTQPFRNKVCQFQVKLRASAAATFKIALIQNASAGTEDVIPSNTIISAWGGNGVNPTLATNFAFVGTPASCSATTALQTFTVAATLPSTLNNILVAVWTDSQVAAAVYMDIAEADFYEGNQSRVWIPRPNNIEALATATYGIADSLGINGLINGGFDFTQRVDPTVASTIADGSYGPDRWKCYRENADLQIIRVDASSESSLNCRNFQRFTKITNNGKFLIAQPMEGNTSQQYRGGSVVFQLWMKASTACNVRIAVLNLTNAGTENTIPAIVSSWGASATDPTFGTNLAILGNISETLLLSTSWQMAYIVVPVPESTPPKNLIPAFWTNEVLGATISIDVAQADFFRGSVPRPFKNPDRSIEMSRIKRFYEKTYPINTLPASNTDDGIWYTNVIAIATLNTEIWRLGFHPYFSVEKRDTPSVAIFELDGTSNSWRIGEADRVSAATNITSKGFWVQNNSGGSVTPTAREAFGHWVAESEL